MEIRPDYEEFVSQVREGSCTAVYTRLIADLETPITLYDRLAGDGRSFLLESGEGEGKNARFSFMGFSPFLTLEARGNRVQIKKEDGEEETRQGNPFEILQEIMENTDWRQPVSLPFCGGAAGYFGYELAGWFEPAAGISPHGEDSDLPDMSLMFPREILAFDHENHLLTVLVVFTVGKNPEEDYRSACTSLEELMERIRGGEESRGGGMQNLAAASPGDTDSSNLPANMSRGEFKAKVEEAKRNIREGEIFQLVLSRRLEVDSPVHPFLAYRTLRSVNPSPYQFYLDLEDPVLCGSSPEMLVRVENGEAWTRPIAGTRPRGKTHEEDLRLAGDLLDDEKERAEHVMLVDLGRNDLGRVCSPGSVRVENMMEVERFSHVMHITTDVKGELRTGCHPLDALQACFPAGTVSGAPKVRAMQLISGMEPTRRGPYSGAVGYLGFNGNLDTCITIRTIVSSGGRKYIQAGAGIVADSDPEKEYRETLQKSQALLKTLSAAEEMIT